VAGIAQGRSATETANRVSFQKLQSRMDQITDNAKPLNRLEVMNNNIKLPFLTKTKYFIMKLNKTFDIAQLKILQL